MTTVDLDTRIPNNVGLADDRRLQRALEGWLPRYVEWWRALGPVEHQQDDVFLRTAISVGQEGWANFDYVRMPDYRWGIFLADPEPDRGLPSVIARASPFGTTFLASIVPSSAACWSSKATPNPRRSSSSATSASRLRASTTCATCSK